jgi:hypothetical protein
MSDIRIQNSLNGDIGNGLHLKKLLPIVLELEEGEWSLQNSVWDEIVYGKTQEEIIASFKEMFGLHYLALKESQANGTLSDDSEIESDNTELLDLFEQYVEYDVVG